MYLKMPFDMYPTRMKLLILLQHQIVMLVPREGPGSPANH